MTRPEPWIIWNTDSTTAMTYHDPVWATWTSVINTSVTAKDAVWYRWVTADAATDGAWNRWATTTTGGVPVRQAAPQLTAEERERLQREHREQQERQRAEQAMAQAKAEALLNRHLTPHQRRTRRQKGWISVRGQSGRLYRLHTNGQVSHNVREMERRGRRLQAVASLCAYPRGLPTADVFLAQLLHLQHDEEHFRRTAYRHPYAN